MGAWLVHPSLRQADTLSAPDATTDRRGLKPFPSDLISINRKLEDSTFSPSGTRYLYAPCPEEHDNRLAYGLTGGLCAWDVDTTGCRDPDFFTIIEPNAAKTKHH